MINEEGDMEFVFIKKFSLKDNIVIDILLIQKKVRKGKDLTQLGKVWIDLTWHGSKENFCLTYFSIGVYVEQQPSWECDLESFAIDICFWIIC